MWRNTSTGARADTCEQTEGRTESTRVIGAFRDYANASKMCYL